MNRRSFWREIGVALALSVVGAVAYHAAAIVIGSAVALRLIVVGLGIVYAVLLFRGLRAKVGRVLAIAAWLVLDAALFIFDPPLLLWLATQALVIWLVRCWCCYAGPFAALADGALCVFSLAAATLSAAHSHSVLLALWSFFLTQALFVLIPDISRQRIAAAWDDGEGRFEHAQRTAAAALRRLTHRN